jgi:hypothetical protein
MTAAPDRRSIPTEYNGRTFRSKLEASWALAFDTLGVAWEYEPKGHYFGRQFYLPDFWLPRSRQYVEVKGVFEPDDCKKIMALLSHAKPRPHTNEDCPDIPIIAAVPDGKFYGWSRGCYPVSWFDFLITRASTLELFQCTRCRGWWFGHPEYAWTCQCCGFGDGNGHLAARLESPLSTDVLPF